jgi:hypothetical protein
MRLVLVSTSIAAVLFASACASSAAPAPSTAERVDEPAAAASKPGACGAATCVACVAEPGCWFHHVSKMCLTTEQAEVCSGETCASDAKDCGAK